ncbi:MAG: AAA family ATPase [Candidatus Micrarchaeia archaeon]
MLKSINLKNWRSHKDSTLNFVNGTNIIIGRMGGGKSSVIDAICFALFGTCPAIQHRRLKVGDYIRNRPDSAKEAEVILVFEHKGEEYSIKRSIKKTGVTEGEVRKNGRQIEGPQSAKVTEFIEGLFDVDYELFTRAIYSEQNKIDYFLTLPRGERKRQIDELLGLNRFEEIRKNVITTVGRLKMMYDDKKMFLKSFDIEKTKFEIFSTMDELRLLDEKLAHIKVKLDEIVRKRKELKSVFDEIESARIKHSKLNERIAGLKHSIEIFGKELKEKKFGKEEYEKLKRDIECLITRKQELQINSDKYDREINILSKKIGELERLETELKEKISKKMKLEELTRELDIKILEDEYQEKEKIKELILQEIADNKAIFMDLEKAIMELDREIVKCPICDSDINEDRRRLLREQKIEMIKSVKKNLESLKSRQTETEKEIKILKDKLRITQEAHSQIKEFGGIEDQLNKIEKEKEEMDSKLEGMKSEKKRLLNELEQILEEYNSLTKYFERMNELKIKQEKYLQFKMELEVLEKEMLSLNFNEEIWKITRDNLEEAMLEETRINGEINSISQRKRFESDKLDDRKRRLKEMEIYEQEIKNYEKAIERLQLFSNAIIETQQVLREELVAAVNEALTEVWGILYPYSDYPFVKIQPSESDYDLVFRLGEGWISVDGIASGGERALACLALKVAFAMVLTPNLSWLILDEPTHNLDEEAVKTLAITLHDHIPKIVEQTLVVTHDENLRDAASGKLFRIERNKEIPEISEVEEIAI